MAQPTKPVRRKPKPGDDKGKKFKKKVSPISSDKVVYVDYKDVNLLRRFMSDRAKIRTRRVSGNDVQQQRDIALAIKVAREMALVPYATRVTAQRGKPRRGEDTEEINERYSAEVEPKAPEAVDADVAEGGAE